MIESAADLASAVRLLTALDGADPAHARRQVERWSRERPGLAAYLVSTQPPGSSHLEHDLYLTDPDGTTIGLTVCADDGTPWLVAYTDHWAANFVVTVNGRNVTIQQALQHLSLVAREETPAAQRLLEHVLEAEAVSEVDEEIALAELQREVDAIRRANGLHSIRDTERWLSDRGMQRADLGRLATSELLARRLRAAIGDARRDAYFAAHPASFARVTARTVSCLDEYAARRIAGEARLSGLGPVLEAQLARSDVLGEWTTATRFALDWEERLAAAPVGPVVGPFHDERGWWVAAVEHRAEPRLDDATARRASRAAYAAWLAERRRAAEITWHWD